jgi:hypothetical protein
MFRALAFAALLLLSACDEDPPSIGSGLPTTFSDARPVFDHRVQERFPVGSEEDVLRAELVRENFTISFAGLSQQLVARRGAEHFPCRLSWTIVWTADAGKVTSIKGDYGATCL